MAQDEAAGGKRVNICRVARWRREPGCCEKSIRQQYPLLASTQKMAGTNYLLQPLGPAV